MGYVGQPLRRVEDARFLRGAGRFVGDLSLPGMLHAAFLRSPHAHARIARIDLAPARAVAGVSACADGEAMAGWARPIRAESRMAEYRVTEWPVLARDRVRYAGEVVAVVVARD